MRGLNSCMTEPLSTAPAFTLDEIKTSLDFPRAYSSFGILPTALFRKFPEDFQVDEVLGFSLAGEGEHACLHIEKRGQNTHWAAAELARYAGVSERDIGTCGRKDRHAITRQWFSLYDPHLKYTDWSGFESDGVRILKVCRHNKKLRPGMHQKNHFVIRLRELCVSERCVDENVDENYSGEDTLLADSDKSKLSQHIEYCFTHGVPNYFGEQRFGRDGSNLEAAYHWLINKKAPSRKRKGMVLSAARSYLFNSVLAERVRQNNWNLVIDGDSVQEDWPTAPLWGRGRTSSKGLAAAIEQKILEPLATWCERLEHQGLSQERRSMVLMPEEASYCWDGNDLVLTFQLPSGTFATSVLSEITQLKNADKVPDVV